MNRQTQREGLDKSVGILLRFKLNQIKTYSLMSLDANCAEQLIKCRYTAY